jgi:hypothetical protein
VGQRAQDVEGRRVGPDHEQHALDPDPDRAAA